MRKRQPLALQLSIPQSAGGLPHLKLSLRERDLLVDESETAFKAPSQQELPAEIHWYLEDFLDEFRGPAFVRAERVRKAICEWGTQLFEVVFRKSAAASRIWER
jgi:hypothetical protein